MKTCKKCLESRPFDGFYVHKNYADKLHAICKICLRAVAKAKAQSDPEANRARAREWAKNNPEKRAAQRANQCPKKASELARSYYLKNREKVIATSRAWREANPEKFREHMRRRPIEPGKNSERTMRRRAAKNNRTPPWVDKAAFVPIYQECQRLSTETGIPHQVDHIVPLRGKTVSGLHVPWNLQVLPALLNQRKGNRLPPEAQQVRM